MHSLGWWRSSSVDRVRLQFSELCGVTWELLGRSHCTRWVGLLDSIVQQGDAQICAGGCVLRCSSEVRQRPFSRSKSQDGFFKESNLITYVQTMKEIVDKQWETLDWWAICSPILLQHIFPIISSDVCFEISGLKLNPTTNFPLKYMISQVDRVIRTLIQIWIGIETDNSSNPKIKSYPSPHIIITTLSVLNSIVLAFSAVIKNETPQD